MQWQDGLVFGSVAEEFTLHEVALATHAMIQDWFHSTQGELVIGYDTRFQSDLAARTVCEVLAAHDIPTVLSKDPVPWGAVLTAIERRKGGGGIFITGGARAVEYNGIRFIRGLETVLSQEDWEKWKKGVNQGEKMAKKDFQIAVSGGLIQLVSLMDEYLVFLADSIEIEKLKQSSLRVLVDSLYGGGQGIITRLCMNEKRNIEEIHQTRHSMFGGLVPIPHSPSTDELLKWLVQHKKHIGIAWDAEGKSWAWVNRYSQSCIPGNKVFKLIKQYVARKSRTINVNILSKDGILQSLLFLEMLVENE